MAPDPTLAFVGGPCCPTLNFWDCDHFEHIVKLRHSILPLNGWSFGCECKNLRTRVTEGILYSPLKAPSKKYPTTIICQNIQRKIKLGHHANEDFFKRFLEEEVTGIH
jgi:hypothetical protein